MTAFSKLMVIDVFSKYGWIRQSLVRSKKSLMRSSKYLNTVSQIRYGLIKEKNFIISMYRLLSSVTQLRMKRGLVL